MLQALDIRTLLSTNAVTLTDSRSAGITQLYRARWSFFNCLWVVGVHVPVLCLSLLSLFNTGFQGVLLQGNENHSDGWHWEET